MEGHQGEKCLCLLLIALVMLLPMLVMLQTAKITNSISAPAISPVIPATGDIVFGHIYKERVTEYLNICFGDLNTGLC